MSLKEVTEHLRKVILQHNPALAATITPIVSKQGNETDDVHLLWMIQQIQTSENMSLTKCSRWIGFIQSVLVSKGYTTVEEGKEITRGMYND